LRNLGLCTDAVLACVQTRPGDQDCLAKAGTRCTLNLAHVAAAEEELASTIPDQCDRSPLLFDDLMSASGLGYESRMSECESTFNVPLTDLGAIGRCVAREHGCETDRLFDVQEARARELLQLVQMPLDTVSCIPDHGAGGDVNDPSETGKAVAKCTAAVNKAAAKFVAQKLKHLEKCVDAIFACVQTKPGDPSCGTRANGACDTAFSRIAVAAAGVAPTVDKRCAAISFATLRGADGANLDALAAECALYDVPNLESLEDYENCLFRQHECRVEELLSFEAPRSDELLGLLVPPARLRSTFCP
jgi:hypothetical protein